MCQKLREENLVAYSVHDVEEGATFERIGTAIRHTNGVVTIKLERVPTSAKITVSFPLRQE